MSTTILTTTSTLTAENSEEVPQDQRDYSKMVLPEPLTLNEQDIFNNLPTIPGQLALTKEGKLIKQVIELGDMSGDLRRQWDQWLLDRLPKQLSSIQIRIAEDKILIFGSNQVGPQFMVDPPRDQNGDLMSPIMAEDMKVTYRVTLYAVPHIYQRVLNEQNESQYIEIETGDLMEIGKIPLMVRAGRCYLEDKRGMQSLKAGTCQSDYGGYFIIGGSRKVVIGQERLGVNQPFLYADGEGVDLLRLTSATLFGTKVSYFKEISEKNGVQYIGFYTDFLGTDEKNNYHWINSFLIYTLLKNDITTEQIESHILSFISNPKHYNTIRNLLIETKVRYSAIPNAIENIITAMSDKNDPDERAKKLIRLQNGLREGLFPHIPEDNVQAKFNLYSLCMAMYLERLAGLRELDNRDSWSNKKIDSAAANMERVFYGTFRKYVVRNFDITMTAAGKRGSPNPVHSINEIRQRMTGRKIADQVSSHLTKIFNGANWGAPDSTRKENVAQQLSNINIVDSTSHIQRVVAPADKQTKQSGIRAVQDTQAVLFSNNETPESEQIGLIKNRTIVCRFSEQSEWTYAYDVLRQAGLLSGVRTDIQQTVALIDGIPVGFVDGPVAHAYLINKRRALQLSRDVTIVYKSKDRILYVKSDWGRPVAPFLVVNPETRKLVMDEKNLWTASFDDILRAGAAEYLSAWEIENSLVAEKFANLKLRTMELEAARLQREQAYAEMVNIESQLETVEDTALEQAENLEQIFKQARRNYENTNDIYTKQSKRRFYSHVMLNPLTIASVAEALIPLFNFVPGARVAYACSHIKQALGLVDSLMLRNDTTVKSMSMAQRPLVTTTMNNILGLDALPQGMTVEVYVLMWGGYNIEDGLIMNQSFADRMGFFNAITKTVPMKTNATTGTGSKKSTEYITPPKRTRDISKYINLDQRGIIKLGSRVKVGDCLIGKTIRTVDSNTNTVEEQDNSNYAKVNEEGEVVDVIESLKHIEGQGYVGQIIIKLQVSGPPEVGDKFANRNAQKSTIVKFLPEKDLPFDAQTGQYPALIINPASIPKRMTMAMIIELMMGRYSNLIGKDILADAFSEVNIENIENTFEFYGYHRKGEKQLMNPHTGKPLEALVFSGPNYYQATRHMVSQKVQGTGLEGPINGINRQRIPGRGKGGGIRLGEMERDALLEHGAHALLRERRLMSDVNEQKFCIKCGEYAVASHIDRTYHCPVCTEDVEVGRVNMPASFSIACRMLLAANIDIRPKIEVVDQ